MENSPKINDSIQETPLETLSLKQILTDKLSDENITSDEAIILNERLHDVLQRNSTTRKEWRKLSYNLRIDFQKAIGADADGAIGAGTMKALKNKIHSGTIDTSPKIDTQAMKSLDEMAYNQEVQTLLNISNKANASAEILNNGNNTREKLAETGISLTEDKDHQIEINEDIENKGFELKRISVSTTNDNGVDLSGNSFGDDTGKTFGFGIDSDFSIGKDNYKIKTEANHYTHGEDIVSNDLGQRNWSKTEFSNSTRLDQLFIDIKKEVLNKSWSDGSLFKISIGGGVQAIGDFGMDKVQKKWHEFTNVYEHKAKYEEDGNGETISGISAHASIKIEGQKQIFGNGKNGIYTIGELKALISSNWKVGENKIVGQVGIKGQFEGYSAAVTMEEKYSGGVTDSQSISSGLENGRYINTTLTAKVPLTDTQLFYNIRNNIKDKRQNTMTVSMVYNF